MTIHQSIGGSPLSADAMSNAMRAELSRELGLALASIFDSTSPPERHLHTQVILAEFYAMSRRNGGLAVMSDDDRDRLFEQGWSEKAINTLSNLVRSHGGLSVIG